MTPVLEFAISLIFVYLLLSALSSAVQEIVANLGKWRAKTLELGVENLLRDEGLKNKLYNHVLVQGNSRPSWLFKKVQAMRKPSYLSSSLFAQVLQDLRTTETAGMPPETQKVLNVILRGAQSADEERQRIEKWFDDSMDNVSGWYKRKSHAWLWIIAIAICGTLNADTIVIGKMLWNEPSARQAMSDVAKQYVTANSNPQGKTEADPKDSEAVMQEAKKNFHDAVQARNQLSDLGMPLGWCTSGCPNDNDPRKLPASFYLWMLKIVGILLSALAVSQGAPFWFDLLQKAVNLRLAGEPPQDSRKPAK